MTHLRKADWEVRTAPLADVRDIIQRYHYAGSSSNTATFRHGLYRRSDSALLGAAQWIPPTKGAAIARFPDHDWRKILSLSRLVIHPDVPTNGASFLIGRSIALIRQDGRFTGLLTYADTWQQHTGAIYRATNWQPAGKTAPEATWLSHDGKLVARKAGPKTRTKAEMEALGAIMIGRFSKQCFRLSLIPSTEESNREETQCT